MQNDGLVTASNEGDSRHRQQPLHSNDLIRCDLEILAGLVLCPYCIVIGHTLFESQQSADNQAVDQSSGRINLTSVNH